MKKTKELKNKLEGIQVKKIQDKFSAKQKALNCLYELHKALKVKNKFTRHVSDTSNILIPDVSSSVISKTILEKLNELDKLLLKEIATNARYLSNADKTE